MSNVCGFMKRIQYLFVVLLGSVWLLSPGSVAAEQWPIKEFQVIKKGPGDWLESENPISDNTAREIERWLKRVAQEYESMGFKKPTFTPVKESILSNKKVLPVYVYPFGSGGQAAMSSPCWKNKAGEFEKIDTEMIADSGRIIENGRLTTKAYQDLAHELFHAVQNSYGLFTRDCNAAPGNWITEGTAEAVGIEMARKLKGKNPINICQIGLRSYSASLYQTQARDPLCGLKRSYLTQSFWQFLGEYSTRKGFIATEEFSEPDFRYLHKFFNTSHAMGSRSKEYAWLNKVLKTGPNFGIRLQSAYSRFVGIFASYWKDKRRGRYPVSADAIGGAAAGGNVGLVEKERKWTEGIFGTCAEVSLTKDTSITLPLLLKPVAARCLKVNFNFSGRVGLTFFAAGMSGEKELGSLAISTNGGKMIVRRHSAEQVPEKIGKFSNISAKNGTPQYFIVSNVAKNPGDTAEISPVLTIVPEIATTALAKEQKAPEPPAPSEKEERKTAGESRSWKGKVWQNKRRPCTRPFEASPCGPTTDIGLGLVPDTTHLFDALSQPSMSGERKFRLFDDVVQEGPEAFVSDLLDDTIAIHQQDGGAVDIVIPQIQPGFTGTISNAHIIVAQAIDAKGSYRALGPWVGSCRDGYWPSTGTVTIEEFSKYIFRGTFSAKLVDTSGLKSCQSGSVSKSDSGSFSITEIDWNLDIEPPEIDDDEIIDDIVDDINATIPGLMSDDLAEYAKEQARKKRQEREQAKQEKAKGKGGVPKECDCGCQMEPTYCETNPQSQCCQYCESIFKMCKGNLSSHSASLTAEEQAKEDAEAQAMRHRYEAYVDSLALPNEAIKQQMMGVFDQLKTIEDKKMFMMSIP